MEFLHVPAWSSCMYRHGVLACIFVAHCRVVYVMYFIQYSQCMYICCIFSYHCSLWMVSIVLYCWILYLSVAALLIMTSIVLHRTWGVTAGIRATRFKTCGLG